MSHNTTRRWRLVAYVLSIVASVAMTVQWGMAGVEWVVIALGLAVTSPIVLPIRWERRMLMAVLVPLALAFLAILTCLCMIGWSFRTGKPVFEGVH